MKKIFVQKLHLHILIMSISLSFIISQKDPKTFSNYEQIKLTNIELNFITNFEQSILHGETKLYFEALSDGEVIVLDSNFLKIKSIIDCDSGEEMEYMLDNQYELESNGIPLKIYRPYSKGDSVEIIIKYETGKESSSIFWVKAEQTAGGKNPFMYTHSEALGARGLFPTQDTPAIKTPISISLTVEKPLVGVASGIYQSVIDNGESMTFFYYQKIPIPSYLLVFAVGNIQKEYISDRISILGEKSLISNIQYYNYIETYIQLIEAYYSTFYEWNQFNILILPYDIVHFSGTENPSLSFISSAFLIENDTDRKLDKLLIHLLCHSWSGGLVSAKGWNDFWLNEGFTRFLERKVYEKLANEDMVKLESLIGYMNLKEDIIRVGDSKSFSSLDPDFLGHKIDEKIINIASEKGYNFLYYLETVINNSTSSSDGNNLDLFRKIIKKYFKDYKYKSIENEDFKNLITQVLNEELLVDKDKNKNLVEDIMKKIDWDDWIKSPGLPSMENNFTNKYSIAIDSYIIQFLSNKLSDQFTEAFKTWNTLFKQYFLKKIRESEKVLDDNQQKILNSIVNNSKDPDVIFEYLMIILNQGITFKKEDEECIDKFLYLNREIKYLRPVYVALYKRNKQLMNILFKKYKKYYHSSVIIYIELDILEFEDDE